MEASRYFPNCRGGFGNWAGAMRYINFSSGESLPYSLE
jgi:hypothetical protein